MRPNPEPATVDGFGVEVVDELVVWLVGDDEATDGVVVFDELFDELVDEEALTGVGETIGVGVNVVVLTGVGL